MRQKKFILSSDYTTLKNDSELVSVSVAIPSSTAVASGATVSYTADVTVGTAGSPFLATIKEPFNNRYLPYQGTMQYVYITGLNQLLGNISLYKTSSTNFRFRINLYNPTAGPVSTEGTTRTFTAYIRTYLPPF